jgi:hypothetical protein
VNDKTFAYLSPAGEPLTISCKLPQSAEAALSLPFTTPTAYGLGKSGWVTATFPDGTAVPVELLREWIDESYRAQAPKRMSAGLPPLALGAGEPLSLEGWEEGPPEANGSTVKQRAASRGAGVRPAQRAKRAAAKALSTKRVPAKAPAAKSPAVKSAAAPVSKRGAAKAPATKPLATKAPPKPKSSRATASAARASAAAGAPARRAPAQRRAAKRLSAGSVSRKRASTRKRTAVKRGPRARGNR